MLGHDQSLSFAVAKQTAEDVHELFSLMRL